VVLANQPLVDADDLPMAVKDNLSLTSGPAGPGSAAGSLPKTVEEVEKARIQEALKRHNGIQARAAKQLGLTNRQIAYKIKKYGIKAEE
jgi:Nif-specific regulatory protein